MRDAARAIIREIGVETGGSNVQFAVNPDDGRMVVIEMNPRVSRSLGAGVEGDRLPDREDRRQARGRLHARRAPATTSRARRRRRSSRPSTTSSSRCRASRSRSSPAPTPRSATQMKSVGEVDGDRPHVPRGARQGDPLARDRPRRLRPAELAGDDLAELERRDGDRRRRSGCSRSAEAMRLGAHRRARRTQLTEIDPWFLAQIQRDRRARRVARAASTLASLDADELRALKRDGLSRSPHRGADRRRDRARCARARKPLGVRAGLQARRHLRRRVRGAHAVPVLDLRGRVRGARRPTSKKVDHPRRRAEPHRPGHRVRLLLRARGAWRCARRASRRSWSTATPRRCRPTTTPPIGSTSSRSRSRTCSTICDVEKPDGRDRAVRRADAAQARGRRSAQAGVPLLGTIGRRDRSRRGSRALRRGAREARAAARRAGASRARVDEARAVADAIGFPVLVRPSYVLGGRAMEIVHDASSSTDYVTRAIAVAGGRRREESAPRRSLPATTRSRSTSTPSADGKRRVIGGVMEHIEEAGIHSGDSACALPPYSLPPTIVDDDRARRRARSPRELGVVGLMNVQFAVQGRRGLRARGQPARVAHGAVRVARRSASRSRRSRRR